MTYFITYGSHNFEISKQRIGQEAIDTGYFDKVILYSDSDLPDEITNSYLFKFRRGGGYWIWKPYIIHETLKKMNDGDFLVYVDSGSKIQKANEWKKYFELLKKYDSVFFLINCTNQEYTKLKTLMYFKEVAKYFNKRFQIGANFLIIKKTNEMLLFVNEWKNTMLIHPELVVDPKKEDLKNEDKKFIENRYDQSILTGLVYKYENKYNIKTKFNHFEGGKDTIIKQATIATRISDISTHEIKDRNIIKSILYYFIALPYRFLYQKFWCWMQ